jgi:hypothetical protein
LRLSADRQALCGFSPPHLGQGSLLRNALLPAPNVSYSQNVMSGKKKTKTYHSAEEFLADLKA